jgi:peptide/nickel transport system substrate-binding protein
MRKAKLLGSGLALLTLVGAASAQSTLRIGLAEDPDVLDPTLARTYVGRIVFASLCDKLFDIDEKLNVVGQLALGQQTSADGKTVTIKLRPNVRFHDGEPFNAEAAKFSLERNLNMPGSFRKAEIAQIDKVEVVDALTIRLLLKSPFAPLIAQLTDRAGMMVSPKAAQALGDKFGTAPVCAGPYKFVERVPQDRIVVEKFKDYWDKDHVFIDRIVYRPIQDSTVRLANLKSGQLDLLERLLATDVDQVKKDSKLRLATGTELGYQGITMNLANGDKANNPLGKSPKVRQAFELALDRDAINQVVFNGLQKVNNQWVSPLNPYYMPKYPTPKRDVARAKALLKEAGVTAPVTLDFMVPNNPESRVVAEVMQSMAGEAGFDLKIRVTEFATSLNEAQLPALLPRLERPHRSRRQHLLVRVVHGPAQLRQVLRPEGRRTADAGTHRNDGRRTQGALRTGGGRDPAEGRHPLSVSPHAAFCTHAAPRGLQGDAGRTDPRHRPQAAVSLRPRQRGLPC